MTEYYFTRHGESQANADEIRAGWMDSPLTKKGRSEAKMEGKRLKKEGLCFDVIISSPLSRAYDTAKIIAECTDYPVDKIITEDTLKERGTGAFENQPVSMLPAADFDAISAAGGETLEGFVERVSEAFDVVRKVSHGKKHVLIVSHAGWYRMAVTLIEGRDVREFYTLPRIDNNTVVKFPL